MKKRVIPLLLLSLLLTTGGSYAQSAAGNGHKKSGTGAVLGHFDVNRQITKGRELSVNYRLDFMEFTNKLKLKLETQDPSKFRADIVDAAGKKITEWTCSDEGIKDISTLPDGRYVLNIYYKGHPASLYNVPFGKSIRERQ